MDVYARYNITIVDEGCGPTILLVHGFGCDQNLWRLVVDRLRSAFRLVLIDLVGSGSSDPAAWDPDEVFLAFRLRRRHLEHRRRTPPAGRGIRRAFGVGDDRRTGDDRRSEPVRQARIADSLPVLYRRRRLSRRLLKGRYRRTAGVAGAELPWRSRAMAPVIMGTPDRPELQDELAETFCRTDPERARVFARTTFLSDNRADLPRIPVPTLVIECSQDAIAPREVGAYVHAHVPGSQLVTLDATGHCPHVSAPDATASAIAAFARAP